MKNRQILADVRRMSALLLLFPLPQYVKMFTKYIFYKSIISRFIARKKLFFKEINSILNDFENCESVNHLRPSFLPSLFLCPGDQSEGSLQH